MRKKNPSPFAGLVNYKTSNIISSSPERLVSVEENLLQTRPIAGTRPRGRNNKEDNLLKKDLINDKKELSEHLMLLDLGRKTLEKFQR